MGGGNHFGFCSGAEVVELGCTVESVDDDIGLKNLDEEVIRSEVAELTEEKFSAELGDGFVEEEGFGGPDEVLAVVGAEKGGGWVRCEALSEMGLECLERVVVFAGDCEGSALDEIGREFGGLEVEGDVLASEESSPDGCIAIGPPGDGFVVPIGEESAGGVVGAGHIYRAHESSPLVVFGVESWESRINATGSDRHESAEAVADIALFGGKEEVETHGDFCGEDRKVGRLFGGVEIKESGGGGDFSFPERGAEAVNGLAGRGFKEDGAVNGAELGDRPVRFAIDFEGEGDFIEFIVNVGGGVCLGIFEGADEDVFQVSDSGGETPCGMGGVSDDDTGDTGDVHAGDFEIGGFDGSFVDHARRVVTHLGSGEEDGVVGC